MRVLVWQLYRTGIAEAYCIVNNYTGPSTDGVVMSRTIIHMGDGKMDNYTVPGLQACSCNPCIQVCQDGSSQEHAEESPEFGKVTTPAAVTMWAQNGAYLELRLTGDHWQLNPVSRWSQPSLHNPNLVKDISRGWHPFDDNHKERFKKLLGGFFPLREG